MKFSAVITLICAPAAVSGFVASSSRSQPTSTSLPMTPQPQQQPQTQGFQKAAMSAVAAVLLAGSIVSVEPAFAAMDASIMNMDSSFGGSSQLVAARSGGRAGGRSSAAMRAPSRPSSAASSMSNTRVIQRTTYISPSPVILAPPMYGYGYNPVPGLGMYHTAVPPSARDPMISIYR